jgi:DNA-binding transcriptional LysR family regulator
MDWSRVDFDWNRTRAFLVTAETGSFSAAARTLGSTQPTVGRQVAALEAELGLTLFERVGPRLELTEAGVQVLEHARQMGTAALGLSLAAAGASEEVEGDVTITASEAMAAFVLAPLIAQLRVDHPGIRVEVLASTDLRDLHRREADLAVRSVRPTRPDLYARRLRNTDAGLFGSPAYVDRAGPFVDLADLSRAELLAFDHGDAMIERLAQIGITLTRSAFPLVVPSHLVQWQLCRAGAGLCFMMVDVGEREPGVVRVLPELVVPVQCWLVCHRELRTSRRLRLVFDRLAAALG